MIHRFADFELDSDAQELRCSGVPVHVERQVLAVLEYLIANRTRVVTKIELLDEVWGDRFVSESALTSRIKSARRACGDNGRDQRVIRTVHGRGYRFVADVVDVAGPDQTPVAAPVSMTEPVSTSIDARLVGRTKEIHRLESALSAALSGRRQAMFVTGHPGTGKSALIAELLERLDDTEGERRWIVLRGQCLDSRGDSEPYFSLLDALTRFARTNESEVVDLLERVAPSWLAQMPSLVDDELAARLETRVLGATPLRMLREGVDAFESLARHRPMLLVLEDVHWADECTLDVIEMLVQRDDTAPLMLLATARPENHRSRGLVASTRSAGRATELRLEQLAPEATMTMVDDWFSGATVPASIHDVVVRRGDGIPLFIQEILTTWVDRGYVVVDGNNVRATVDTSALEDVVPETVQELIDVALSRLDPEEVDVLDVAAVVGLEFDSAAVAGALARPLPEVESVLARLSRAHTTLDAVGRVEWPDGTVSTRFAFRHDLHRQAVTERMPAGRRAALHLSVAATLEQGFGGHSDEVVVDLARHFVEAGENRRAVEHLRRAGELASARSAHTHAAGFLRQALDRVGRLPHGEDTDRAELAIRMSLGPVLVVLDGWFGPEVMTNYQRAMDLCAAMDPCPELDLVRYSMATVTELRGEYERTEELLVPLFTEPADEMLVEACELMACSTFHQGRFETAIENALSLLDRWGPEHHSQFMARVAEHPAAACNSWVSLATWYLGHSDDSLRFAEQAIELGESNPYALSTARVQRAHLHQFRREPGPCSEWAQLAASLAAEQGFPMRAAQAHLLSGWADCLAGDVAGLRRIAESLEGFRSSGARLAEPYYLALWAEGSLALGDAPTALALLQQALHRLDETTRTFFYGPEIFRLQAAATLAGELTDDGREVRHLLDRAVDTAERLGAIPLVLRASADRLRFEQAHGNPGPWQAKVARLLEVFEGQADVPDVLAARALLTK